MFSKITPIIEDAMYRLIFVIVENKGMAYFKFKLLFSFLKEEARSFYKISSYITYSILIAIVRKLIIGETIQDIFTSGFVHLNYHLRGTAF